MKPLKFYNKKYENKQEPEKRYTLYAEGGRNLGTFQRLKEVSLSRVWQHHDRGFVTASAFRSEYSEEANLKRHDKLKQFLKSDKVGYFEIDGVYQDEEYWTEDGKFDPDKPFVSELSVFIPFDPRQFETFEDFADWADDLGQVFDQDSVLIVYPKSEGGEAYFVRGNDHFYVGKNLGLDTLADTFHSVLRKGSHKGKRFQVRESLAFISMRKPASYYEVQALKNQGIKF